MKNSFLLSTLLILFLAFTSCKKDNDDPAKKELKIAISGLEDLGDNFAYEGWLIVNDKAVSAGVFDVDSSGTLSQTSFSLEASDINNASAYVLTIEPNPDTDPSPSAVHILAGDFSKNSASLTVNHSSAIGTDFATATGKYTLGTPTDGGDDDNEKSGVWWISVDQNNDVTAGLTLPPLPSSWKYEGWAVIDGNPVSTGTFTSANGADSSNPHSGELISEPFTGAFVPFPGEDFLYHAPTGLTFPTELTGKTVVISVEPNPDNSSAPFLLKPLIGNISETAESFKPYSMTNNAVATNPTGTISR